MKLSFWVSVSRLLIKKLVSEYGLLAISVLAMANLAVVAIIILHAHTRLNPSVPFASGSQPADIKLDTSPRPTSQIIIPSLHDSQTDAGQSEPGSLTPTPDLGETAVVARVVDGDTVELSTGQKVRYIGIDTPETVDPRKPVQCFGEQASVKNKSLVEGKTVTLVKDVSETDKYGRLLRYVYVGDLMVNDFLIRNGYARLLTIPPDVAKSDQFMADQQLAQQQRLGLWSIC